MSVVHNLLLRPSVGQNVSTLCLAQVPQACGHTFQKDMVVATKQVAGINVQKSHYCNYCLWSVLSPTILYFASLKPVGF